MHLNYERYYLCALLLKNKIESYFPLVSDSEYIDILCSS